MEPGRALAGSAAASSRPQVDSRDAAATDSWTSFLQCYDSLLARELAQEHPQFVRALRQLERDSRLQQERQSAQVLATLRLKDARTSELQRLVSEQREQLDVVLDELERRETKEDKQVQVDDTRVVEDAAVQTETVERTFVNVETQTEGQEEERRVLPLLQKLEKELEAVEQRNVALQRELQQRARVIEAEEVKAEEDEQIEACLETLKRGVEAMDLSCGCVDTPLAFLVGVPQEGTFGGLSKCVNLEHRLEAQAVRLEHLQEGLYLWRDAAVQLMKRQNVGDEVSRSVVPSVSHPVAVRCAEGEEGVVNCSVALRGALKQMRKDYSRRSGRRYGNEQQVLKDLAQVLAQGKGGVKTAAKMVQKWAGWEARHLEEVRALRQDAAEERAVAASRRIVLLKRIDQLEQRELDLQAELNALRKNIKDHGSRGLLTSKPVDSCEGAIFGADNCERPLKYPQLMLRLATAEQNVLVKDEQLRAANGTIRALTSCTPTPSNANQAAAFYSGNDTDSLAVEAQRSLQQKLEFFRRREKDLVNLSQYFGMEKTCLQLKSRLDAAQKQTAMLQAAQQVCERERDELLMKVEKLESEAVLASITSCKSTAFDQSFSMDTDDDDMQRYVYFMVKRLRLVEDDNKQLRDRLRQSLQQTALMMRQQPPYTASEKTSREWRPESTAFDMIADHHRKCVSDFKVFHEKQSNHVNAHDAVNGADEGVGDSCDEWAVLLTHYEDLWIAFYSLYSIFEQDSKLSKTDEGSSRSSAQSNFDGRINVIPASAGGTQQRSLEMLEFELSKRDEKIMLLQEKLMAHEGRLCGFSTKCGQAAEDCDAKPEQSDFGNDVTYLADTEPFDARNSDSKVLFPIERPFLASTKPPEPPLQLTTMSSNGPSNEIALVQPAAPEESTQLMESQKYTDSTAKELERCLTKCAELTSKNTKLARRLREEKDANKKYLKETQELQKQLSARTDANSELERTLKQYQNQASKPSSLLDPSTAGGNIETSLQSNAHEENISTVAGNGDTDITSPTQATSQQKYDELREQLASREQENLTLVQSLCMIKEKCAQMEATHQKELRVKAAEHAEAMESYMGTVNETLSRIESDKHCLEDENVKLRSKLQQFEEESTRQELERPQRSSKGTNTDDAALESSASTREKDSLKARVADLELQLARERKLTEMVEQKKQLENQHEEQEESAVKMEAAKAKQEYEARCEALKEWRNKLHPEFAEYQAVERAAQEESDRRIDFLSTCIEEIARLADTQGTGRNISSDELYDLVMDLARDPLRGASKNFASSSQLKRQSKQKVLHIQRQKMGNKDLQSVTTLRDISWSEEERNQDESEKSEVMMWKLRASKMEAYVRSAMLQNDTFEDTIRQLELGLSRVKEELTSRLAREAQLVAKLGALKSELATTKEQAASLAEKYQVASAELEKRQGEVTNRGDETQRARMAVQRKTELLTQQKAKVTSLQQELELAVKKIERLGSAEKQAALLQQKAKEHTQQLLHARQSYESCRDDNVQLSFHLEKLKERHAAVVSRLKVARAENAQLRTQCSDLKNSATQRDIDVGARGDTHRSNQGEANGVSIASLTEEARALKRRVLQKQDVIVSYKSKVAEYEAQLERQRETMVKLARTNRELQQGQRQRQQQELEFTSALQTKLEGQLEAKQEQLDGLRASVYDSFEAFVFCRTPSSTSSPTSSTQDSPVTGDTPDVNDKLFDIKRWTDFSVDDLEDLRLARGALSTRTKRESEERQRSNKINKRKAAAAALREVEGALETTPEDCRAEICELLQCLCT